MGGRTIVAAGLLSLALAGCVPPETEAPPAAPSAAAPVVTEPPRDPATKAAPPARPFQHESDREYQNGLASLLQFSPVYGAGLVTSAFRVGYLTGLDEGGHFQSSMDGRVGSLGCLNGYASIKGLGSAGEVEVARVEEICANKAPESEIQGALFSAWRLKEAQWAAEHLHDPDQIKGVTTFYVVGYNMGFARAWESVDQEAHVEQVAGERCEWVVKKFPLSSAQMTRALNKCADEARAVREQYGQQLKCMLAIRGEMNGDLSGESSKPGCASK